MDKRLLKSLTTAKTRYENTIADAQAKLHVVNSMLESLLKEEPAPEPEPEGKKSAFHEKLQKTAIA